MKIIDCILYSDEIELLEVRINYLKESVDYFVLATGNRYHSGAKKQNDFSKEIQLAYNEGVMLFIVEVDFTKFKIWNFFNLFWKRRLPHYSETIQRSFAVDKIKEDFDSKDLLMFSDVDEIPSIKFIDTFGEEGQSQAPLRVLMQNFYYDYRLKGTELWLGTYVSSVCNAVSSQLRTLENIGRHSVSGWHLSYMGGEKVMKQKLKTFSHSVKEGSLALNDWETTSQHIKAGEDLFGRGIKFEYCDNVSEIYDAKILSLINNNQYLINDAVHGNS